MGGLKPSIIASTEEEDDWLDETIDGTPVRGTRLLSDIYQRCNIAVCEPVDFAEAKKDQKWVAAMEEELSMIKKTKLGAL